MGHWEKWHRSSEQHSQQWKTIRNKVANYPKWFNGTHVQEHQLIKPVHLLCILASQSEHLWCECKVHLCFINLSQHFIHTFIPCFYAQRFYFVDIAIRGSLGLSISPMNTSECRLEEPGIEHQTSWLVDDPLYHLSLRHPTCGQSLCFGSFKALERSSLRLGL